MTIKANANKKNLYRNQQLRIYKKCDEQSELHEWACKFEIQDCCIKDGVLYNLERIESQSSTRTVLSIFAGALSSGDDVVA